MSGWVMGGSAVVGAGASLAGAGKNASAAKSAAQLQAQSQGNDLAFRQAQYNRYLGLMGPIEQQQATQAQSSQPLYYDQNAAAIKQNYGNALRNSAQNMSMRGIAGSGLDQGAMQNAAMGQASALSGAWNQGLVNRQNLGLTLTGRGQLGQAANSLSGGMQNMANMYGNYANQYNNAAAMGWNNFGSSMNGLANMAGRGMFNTPQQQQPGNNGLGSSWGNENPPSYTPQSDGNGGDAMFGNW